MVIAIVTNNFVQVHDVLVFILEEINPDKGEALFHLGRGIPIDDVTPIK